MTTTYTFVSTLTVGTYATRHDSLTGEISTIYLRPGDVVGRLTSVNGHVLVTFGSYKVWVPEQDLAPVV